MKLNIQKENYLTLNTRAEDLLEKLRAAKIKRLNHQIDNINKLSLMEVLSNFSKETDIVPFELLGKFRRANIDYVWYDQEKCKWFLKHPKELLPRETNISNILNTEE